jgi:hypothetical protein
MKNLIKILALLLPILTFGQSAKQVETVSLLGDALFPEGIITLPNNDLIVGGFGDGSLQRINSKNEVSYFSKPGENGMVIAVGMAIDTQRKHLWVANFNFKTESGNPGSNLKVFDLSSGKLLKTIPEKFIDGVFFNEVTIDKAGQVYVSNTFGPQIWTSNFNSSEATVLVENELLSNPAPDQPFDLNGLIITPDQKYLIASVMDRLDAGDGKLVRIDIKTKAVSDVKLTGADAVKAFAGSDGMFFHGGQLFMVNVYSKAGAIITAKFNASYSEAVLTIRDKFNNVYDRPTASAIRSNKLFTVNSQLNHIIDDADGQLNTPHEKPFKVVGVPLKDLLK